MEKTPQLEAICILRPIVTDIIIAIAKYFKSFSVTNFILNIFVGKGTKNNKAKRPLCGRSAQRMPCVYYIVWLYVVEIVVRRSSRKYTKVRATMPRRGESIYKRSDGRWEARYVKEIGADGKKKYASVYAWRYNEAKEKRQQILQSTPPVSPRSQLTVSQLMSQWLGHIHSGVKPATYQKYESLASNHIVPALGSKALAEITRADVDQFARTQKEHGRLRGGTLSAKTVNDILIVLGLAFEYAEQEHQLSLPRIKLIKDEKREARVLSCEERETLTRFLLNDMDEFKFCVLLALYTGLRIGELSALRWEDISGGCVRVSRTMQRLKRENGGSDIVIGSPKSTSSRRTIPLPSFMLPYVEQFRRPDGYVLRTRRSQYAEPRSIQLRFGSLMRQCQLQNVTFHTLRHTFATQCIEAGFDVKTLSEILGHTDVKTTLNRYVHSSLSLKQRNMEKLTLPSGGE